MERDNCGYDAAIHTLADDFNITIDGSDEYHEQVSIADRNKSWMEAMEKQVDSVREYLHKRGITDDTIARFHLGYSTKKSALAIPMIDSYGRVKAFIYRYFEGKTRYRNSRNDILFTKGQEMYNEFYAQQRVRVSKVLFLCEGPMDVMSGDQQDLAIMGYSGITLTKGHLGIIRRMMEPIKGGKIILTPDNDSKADKMVPRARTLFRELYPRAVVKVARITTHHKDFNEIVADDKKIMDCIDIEPIDLYCVKEIVASSDDQEVQEKAVLDFMKSVSNPLVRQDIATYLAGVWQRDISVVKELLSIRADTTEEKLADITTIDKAYSALEHKQIEETFGIGFANIDSTMQLSRKSVFVIGAYSFSGKTDMLCEVLLHTCIVLHKKCLFFSLEMPVEDVMKVLIAKIVGVERYRVPQYIKDNPGTYQMICDKLRDFLYIVDKNSLSLDDIADYAKLLKSRGIDIELIAVDYFSYLRGTSTIEEQENTAKQMKALAKSLNVTLIMLSQLRKSSQTKEKAGVVPEPSQVDLMGSGAIGNSSDYIALLWRPALSTALSPIDREKLKYTTMFKITKAREVRNGNTMFELEYNPATSRLTEKVVDT